VREGERRRKRRKEKGDGTLKRRTFPHEPPKMRSAMVGPLDPRCPEADKNSYKTAYRCFLPFAPALLLLIAVSLRHLLSLGPHKYSLLHPFNLVSRTTATDRILKMII